MFTWLSWVQAAGQYGVSSADLVGTKPALVAPLYLPSATTARLRAAYLYRIVPLIHVTSRTPSDSHYVVVMYTTDH